MLALLCRKTTDTGTTFEEMEGWGWQKVHHPDHVDRVVQRIRHSFETGTPWEDTFPLRGPRRQLSLVPLPRAAHPRRHRRCHPLVRHHIGCGIQESAARLGGHVFGI